MSIHTSTHTTPAQYPHSHPHLLIHPSHTTTTAADGQHLYLHPINARCLMKEYGKLECAPQEIRAQIVDLEQHSITKVLVVLHHTRTDGMILPHEIQGLGTLR